MSTALLVEAGRPWVWAGFFAADPRGWILESAEPAAGWSLLSGVIDRADDASIHVPRLRVILVRAEEGAVPLRHRTGADGPPPLDDLAPEARAIDVTTLSSSKGGTGVAVPPSSAASRG